MVTMIARKGSRKYRNVSARPEGGFSTGKGLGLALAYAWAAFPYTAFVLETNANDTLVALACIGALLLPLAAHAQAAGDFPNKPIRMVVTFPPGGSADAVVRMITPRLNEKLGQQVVVDNRPGAGGSVGGALVAQAPADGYTLMLSNSTPISRRSTWAGPCRTGRC